MLVKVRLKSIKVQVSLKRRGRPDKRVR